MQVIKGIIVRKKYQNSDNSWHIVTFKVMNGNVLGNDITVKGYIPWSSEDDLIELEGEYKDSKYGQEFVATQAWRSLPRTLSGIKNYLVEEVPGVGPTKARALGELFGNQLRTILDNFPDRLGECPAISPKLAQAIKDNWAKEGLTKNVGLFLSQYEISHVWVKKIIDTFGIYAIENIKNNPYALTKIRGIGFAKADEIAIKLGFKKDSEERIKACFTHVLNKSMEDGHCFLQSDDLKKEVLRLTKANSDKLDEHIKNLVETKQLIEEVLTSKDINLKVYYLPYIYSAEEKVAEDISSLLNPSRVKLYKRNLEGLDYSNQQKEAILGCFDNRISVITGSPGTGKTSSLKGVVDLANRNGISFALCAPTGRASKRLSEITNEEATTIHRLLKFDGMSNSFNSNKDSPLTQQMIIVDESSMIDIELAGNLLDAIGPDTNIVFIGDTDQLPSVGPGSFLKDLIKSKTIKTTNLTTIFRQAQQSLMVQNSHRIKNGEYPVFPPKGSSADSYVMTKPTQAEDSEWALQAVKDMVSIHILRQIKLLHGIEIDVKKDLQILIPMKKGEFGVYEANRKLQGVFNPNGRHFIAHGKNWHIGDKVIQNVNNYSLDVFNGDLGIITGFDPIEKKVVVDYDGKSVVYDYKQAAENLDLAWVITTHKSQGSEYKVVIVVLLWQHFPMLERNLLYTANTRAKLMTLYIVAGGAIKKAVDTNKVKSRNSLLSHRIRRLNRKQNDDSETFNNTCDGDDVALGDNQE